MIDLSIIIVSWNSKEYLLPCIASIFETTKRIPTEVIVIDNHSSDGSGPEVKKTFPGVHLILNEKNSGFARATNQGLKESQGRYVLLLNPDTRMKEGAIERLLSFMETHSKVGVSGGQLLNRDGSKQNSIANFPSLATELLNKSLLRWMFPKKFPGKERNSLEPIEVDSVIGACMIVRRDAMERVGLLDEGYFLFLEETDWCYRMKKTGWKVYHLPQAEAYHYQGQSAEREKKKAKVEYYRSRYHFFKKNRGEFQWSILLIGLVLRLAIELIFTTLICLFTFFSINKWRRKLSIFVYLFWWHMRLCPEGMGLRNGMGNGQ
ncbi:MAG: glycosyltransferase family 2 protein [Thermodesulfobacteriota bacterium]